MFKSLVTFAAAVRINLDIKQEHESETETGQCWANNVPPSHEANRSYYENICENGPARYNKTKCTDKIGQEYFCGWDSTTPRDGNDGGNSSNGTNGTDVNGNETAGQRDDDRDSNDHQKLPRAPTQTADKFESLGCYKDKGGNRTLTTYVSSARDKESCAHAAKLHGAKYFGMQCPGCPDGPQCFVGSGDYAAIGKGDGCKKGLGAFDRNSVYGVNYYHPLGCWKDKGGDRTLTTYVSSARSKDACEAAAREKGAKFFGMQCPMCPDGPQCFVGSGDYKRKGAGGGCKNGLGGWDRNDVYGVEYFQPVGCYKDKGGNRTLTTYVSSARTKDSCAHAAKEHGAKFFGMQCPGCPDGPQCFVGNGDYAAIGEGDGCKKGLGGFDRNSVYQIDL